MTPTAEKALIRKMAWKVLPFLLVAYLICIIDRLNVGLAALTMNAELGFTATVYGWRWLFILEGVTDTFHIGLSMAIPYLIATICMVLWSRHSDKTGERVYHCSGALALAAIGMVSSALNSPR